MPRLLIVSNLFHPDRGGGASVISDLCVGLAEAGYEVMVYTTYPYYPEWKNKSGANLLEVAQESFGRLTVKRFGLYIPSHPSKLSHRLLYEGSFLLSLLRAVKPMELQRYDLVMTFCPLLSAVAYGALVRALTGVSLWINIQDIPSDAARISGISRSRLFDKIAANVQISLFAEGEAWSTISLEMLDKLNRDYNRYERRIYFLPNWLHPTLAHEIQRLPDRSGRPGQEPMRLLYAGNIGKKQELLEFCRFLQKQHHDFTFHIHGDGAEAHNVERWVVDNADNRFQFGPFLEERDFAAALREADFFVITQAPREAASFIPTKRIAAFASGTPVVAICDRESPLGQEIINFDLGRVFEWSALVEVLPELERLVADYDRVLRIRGNCLSRNDFYSREAALRRYVDALGDVCQTAT